MILKYAAGLVLAAAGALPAPAFTQTDPAATIRRLAATATLASQEYAIGVRDGVVISSAEVAEAELFLGEAMRAAQGLPPAVRSSSKAAIDAIIGQVRATTDPAAVAQAVNRLTLSLSEQMGVVLDATPRMPPSPARGAMVYREQCASCHGAGGDGQGPAAPGLDPAPADLSDAILLADRSPLDFYRKVTIGVAGTSMPAFEDLINEEDRWAVAAYISRLRLPEPSGPVPPHLWWFANRARMSDRALAEHLMAMGADSSASAVAAVRAHPGPEGASQAAVATMALARVQADSAYAMSMSGQSQEAGVTALGAYITFEGVESSIRARSPGLAAQLEGAFARYRAAVADGPPQEARSLHLALEQLLNEAQQEIGQQQTPFELFIQSFVILLREGIEAILIIGALIAFLVKTGAGERRRDVYFGVGAALVASVFTAVLIETVFHLSVAHQELLEGATMLLAAGVLFYVSYWLLSKMEVARWNRFVKGKVEQALVGGSLLALPTVAFLAVYREGFETVLFYKALFVSSGAVGAALPVVGGMVAASLVLVVLYLGISRYGVRVPLKPFFGITGAFLYYMAFVFAGKGILELQGADLLSVTHVSWSPVVPALGIYGTAEGLIVQGCLLVLFMIGLVWSFVIEPRRLKVTSILVPDPNERPRPLEPASTDFLPDGDLVRSLERMDADLAEVRAEISRIRDRVVSEQEGYPRS